MSNPNGYSMIVVTATVDLARAEACVRSWGARAGTPLPLVVVRSRMPGTPDLDADAAVRLRLEHSGYYAGGGPWWTSLAAGGSVPALAWGVDYAFANGAEAVVCLHDDVEITEAGWAQRVREHLAAGVRFAGFGGSTGIGAGDLYRTPYEPSQLGRLDFYSNLREAEVHGGRVQAARPCVYFDGFCQIGTADWFRAAWQWLAQSGVKHHAYDGILAALAARAGVQPGTLIPVACHHYSGQTAIACQDYRQWAERETAAGDFGLWRAAHDLWYEQFRDVMPLRLP